MPAELKDLECPENPIPTLVLDFLCDPSRGNHEQEGCPTKFASFMYLLNAKLQKRLHPCNGKGCQRYDTKTWHDIFFWDSGPQILGKEPTPRWFALHLQSLGTVSTVSTVSMVSTVPSVSAGLAAFLAAKKPTTVAVAVHTAEAARS